MNYRGRRMARVQMTRDVVEASRVLQQHKNASTRPTTAEASSPWAHAGGEVALIRSARGRPLAALVVPFVECAVREIAAPLLLDATRSPRRTQHDEQTGEGTSHGA